MEQEKSQFMVYLYDSIKKNPQWTKDAVMSVTEALNTYSVMQTERFNLLGMAINLLSKSERDSIKSRLSPDAIDKLFIK